MLPFVRIIILGHGMYIIRTLESFVSKQKYSIPRNQFLLIASKSDDLNTLPTPTTKTGVKVSSEFHRFHLATSRDANL